MPVPVVRNPAPYFHASPVQFASVITTIFTRWFGVVSPEFSPREFRLKRDSLVCPVWVVT